MAKHSTRDLATMARQAGYRVLEAEQLRPNRWLLTLEDSQSRQLIVLVQDRPLITASDVVDLAEIVRLRRLESGILLALDGSFSSAALQTHQELHSVRLRLCTSLPSAATVEHHEPKTVSAALKSPL
jgi:hypothetical protein